ncbi:uncharacterized protein B0I36DRAFT_350987 [Microdochium trichocladiopsis]|uniref:Uncharacterized protein n=1 Tax=Microdochium trichocladiopsis TaxID=1682393 RepID=A0A9P9BRN5_9PEZI|nr:uncharacterized protein B0I36DRAFT_350987 [Microdochium trichocladiopsis]KAH7027460.1 hypothetical protein B0I36DRAFT_350987 [Microdochium trichocladiopsis]
MGFFDGWDGASVISSSSKHTKHHKSSSSSHKSSRKRSKSRSRSRDRKHRSSGSASVIGNFLAGSGSSHYNKHNSSKASFFNLGNNSSRSLFGGLGMSLTHLNAPPHPRSDTTSTGRSSSSYYRRQPRANFVQRAIKYLKKLLRDLVYYAKRHPMKVFMIVIMPLITGGALTALLATFGLRLPPSVERMLGVAAKTASGDGIGLVGEAVRMASNLGGSGGGSAFVEHGRDGGLQWERKGYSSTSSDWGIGGGLMGGVKDFFR